MKKNETPIQTPTPTTQKNENIGIEKLKELKAMQESGLISEDEYNTYKDAILKQLISMS